MGFFPGLVGGVGDIQQRDWDLTLIRGQGPAGSQGWEEGLFVTRTKLSESRSMDSASKPTMRHYE